MRGKKKILQNFYWWNSKEYLNNWEQFSRNTSLWTRRMKSFAGGGWLRFKVGVRYHQNLLQMFNFYFWPFKNLKTVLSPGTWAMHGLPTSERKMVDLPKTTKWQESRFEGTSSLPHRTHHTLKWSLWFNGCSPHQEGRDFGCPAPRCVFNN